MNIEQKQHWLSVMKEHQAAGRITQDKWTPLLAGDGLFRMCLFGCEERVCANPYNQFSNEMGIPVDLVNSIDLIFSSLPKFEAALFPVQFFEAVVPESDLLKIHHAVHVIHNEKLLKYCADNNITEVIPALQKAIAAHKDYSNEELAEAAKQALQETHRETHRDPSRSWGRIPFTDLISMWQDLRNNLLHSLKQG